MLALLLAGCAGSLSNLAAGKPRNVPLEFRQKVGLYVHDQAERFYYPGQVIQDTSELMAFHIQQILPYSSEETLKEIFSGVELKPPGPRIEFKSPELAGYFEVKVSNARYDYPDSTATNYRAEIELTVLFKTLNRELIWSGIFRGDGISFPDDDRSLTRFGKEAGTALEDAFQDAIFEMQDGILASQRLRAYFRSRMAERVEEMLPSPAPSRPSGPDGSLDEPVGSEEKPSA